MIVWHVAMILERKTPSLGRFLHTQSIAAEISKFMLQSLSNPQVTSRLVLPLENFLRHLWPRCNFLKHCPGSIECVGKRMVIVRHVEMILERKTRAWAVFDQCLSKNSLKTHAFWLYFQSIFHQKNGENCSGGVKFIPKCSEKFQEGTRPLRETFGNFRGRENDEKCKKSPNGTPWVVIDKSVPGSNVLLRNGVDYRGDVDRVRFWSDGVFHFI